MGNKRKRFFVKAVWICVCLMGIGLKGSKVQAEEIEIIREATGDLEELRAIRISYEEADAWEEAVPGRAADIPADEDVSCFLECGTDYGYRDMGKRSNSAGRQYAYQKLMEICNAFTISVEAANRKQMGEGGSIYYTAGTVRFDEYNLTDDEIIETYFTFRNDNPQFFWLSNSLVYGTGRMEVLTYNEYADGAIRHAALEEIIQTAQNVYQSKITSNDNNYEKVLKLHDTLIGDIEYAFTDMNRPTAHSIAGAMTSEKSAVCEGYAKVMQVMMNYYNIVNVYVTGTSEGEGHAWNMVSMSDGKYYWLDATWDDQVQESVRHKFFLVGNRNFPLHEIDLPENTRKNFLYELPSVSEDDYVYDSGNQKNVKGDINGDGSTNLFDLMLCLNHVARKSMLEGEVFRLADVDENGKVDLFDLMRILNYVAKKTDMV